jgi:hypothetical protein
MRKPSIKSDILLLLLVIMVFAGLLWSLTRGRRTLEMAPQEAERKPIRSPDLRKRLKELRVQIDKLDQDEDSALFAANSALEQSAFNRSQAEHVGRFGVPGHREYYMKEMARCAKEAAAERDRAASFGRKKWKLVEEFDRLLASAPPDVWPGYPDLGAGGERLSVFPSSP